MKFRPLHDRVLIKVLDSEEKTAGGIIIPDTAKEKPQEGEVIAVGPGSKNENGKLSSQCSDFLIASRNSLRFWKSMISSIADFGG